MSESDASSRNAGRTSGARARRAAKAGEHGYVFTDQVGHLLRKAYQRHAAIFQQTIADSQLTAAQFVVLCAVEQQGGCSMAEIVKTTAIDQATVRGVVDRLKARGLIAVSHDASDRRKVVVQLTRRGVELLERTIPQAREITEMTFGDLNPAERVAVVYLLRRLSEGPAEPAA